MSATRRRLLLCLPAAVAPGTAGAFRREEATAEVTVEYEATACPRTDLPHVAPLAAPAPAAPPQPGGRCPFCGCAVLGAPDHGERAPPAD